jgi:hypothetical protein
VGLSMAQRKAVTKQMARRYVKATKIQKTRMLDELVAVTGWTRRHARRAITESLASTPRARPAPRPRIYTEDVIEALTLVWAVLNGPSGKRLAPFMGEIVEVLERTDELHLGPECREKLCRMSAAGDFCQTLTFTCVATGWTETWALKNKAQRWCFAAIRDVERTLPFPLLGIDSDNGSEFINDQLYRYCTEREITFTRTRPYRKNDNCFVEQKNWPVVRQQVGYLRYDTPAELEALGELYSHLRLYVNFFQPQMKLIEKTRHCAKVTKRYDRAQTPYRRTLASAHVADRVKAELTSTYLGLNPVWDCPRFG